MWIKKFFSGSDLHIQSPFTFTNLSSVILSRLDMMGEIRGKDNKPYAKLKATGRAQSGGHSILEEYWRTDKDTNERELVLLKKPKDDAVSLRTEAFIQWLAHKIFDENGLGERIPKVCDIIELPDKTECFIMSKIQNSILCSHFLAESKNIQRDLFHVLIQVSMLIQILEDQLSLDHRDLKADNLLIKDAPSTLTFYLTSQKKHFTVKSPFTVCMVDFGFACLGDASVGGKTQVDAGEGTLPHLDPCPKDGRDLYHLIVSLYSLDTIYNRLSLLPELDALFKSWMEVLGRETHPMARRWSHSEWVYLLTSRKEFNHPLCSPKAVIEKIMAFDPGLFKLDEEAGKHRS